MGGSSHTVTWPALSVPKSSARAGLIHSITLYMRPYVKTPEECLQLRKNPGGNVSERDENTEGQIPRSRITNKDGCQIMLLDNINQRAIKLN